jgi:hypothetical protein
MKANGRKGLTASLTAPEGFQAFRSPLWDSGYFKLKCEHRDGL